MKFDKAKRTRVRVLNSFANSVVYVHFVFESLLFSFLLFLEFLNALRVVARYVASALVCRAILLIELGGVKSPSESATLAGAHPANPTSTPQPQSTAQQA